MTGILLHEKSSSSSQQILCSDPGRWEWPWEWAWGWAGCAIRAWIVAVTFLAAGCAGSPPPEAGSPRPEAAAPLDPDGPSSPNVVELTIDRVQADYASGRYSAQDLTRAFLTRIGRFEARYNAFISLNPDALVQAAELDEEYRRSGPRGPLHGVPLVIKDNIDYGGSVTTAGYEGFSAATGGVDMIPDDDAAVVQRLREAGAIILGKTNLPDFAGHGTRTRSSVEGVTLNPYDTTRAPGGSSGGTATAVNASFAVAGIGTETGGSIQNPSSAQALVGVKPTFGLVPLEGVVPMSATYVDVVGPMARTVRDAAEVLDVIAGPSAEDPRTQTARGQIPPGGYVAALDDSALVGRRFGLVGTGWRTSFLPLAPATEKLYGDAVAVLQAQGAQVVEDPFQDSGFVEKYRQRPRGGSRDEGEMAEYLRGLGPGAAFHSVEEWEALAGRPFRDRGDRERARADTSQTDTSSAGTGGRERARMDSGARRGAEGAAGPTVPDEEASGEFLQWRTEILDLFRAVLRDHDLDGLFFPQAGAPIPDLVEDPDRPDYNPNNHPELPSNIVNEMGIPVVTVPFAYYEDGTPFVLAFIGDMWSEARLLAYAYDLEQATRGRIPPKLEPAAGG